jgi:hypothetical protein
VTGLDRFVKLMGAGALRDLYADDVAFVIAGEA